MTIGIDLRVLSRGSQTGVQQYLVNLLPRLFNIDSNISYKLFYNGFKKRPLSYHWLRLPNVQLKAFKLPNRFLDLSSRLLGGPKLDKLIAGADVYFIPHFLVTKTFCPKAVTFHDLSFEYYPEFFSARRRLWHKSVNPKKVAQEAERIIAVSESTRQDLVNLYKIKPEKIKVIYSGVGEEFRQLPITRKKYNLPKKFILYFGVLEPRKNLVGLIKAFEIFRTKNNRLSEYKLVIAGAEGWLFKKIYQTAKESKFSQDIIFTGFIKEKDKPALYNLASLFVYPSFFEGFGFPPLEAMACGVPVITSNNSSLPEVVGDAGLMVNAADPDELAWVMAEVLSDEELRNELTRRGLKRAKEFSWRKCAKKTLRVLLDTAS